MSTFPTARILPNGLGSGAASFAELPRIGERFADLQTKSQSKRFEIISLLNILMTQHRIALRGLGTESLVGLVDLFAGEKDPRNLMVVFSVLRVVIAEWDIASQVEVSDIQSFYQIQLIEANRPFLTQCSATSQSRFGLHRAIHMGLQPRI